MNRRHFLQAVPALLVVPAAKPLAIGRLAEEKQRLLYWMDRWLSIERLPLRDDQPFLGHSQLVGATDFFKKVVASCTRFLTGDEFRRFVPFAEVAALDFQYQMLVIIQRDASRYAAYVQRQSRALEGTLQ